MVVCLERGANDLCMIQLMPLPQPSSFASLKSRLVLPFWCRFTQVVPEKRPLHGCLSVSISGNGARYCIEPVCMSVCYLPVPVSQKSHVQTPRNFLYTLPVAVAVSMSDDSAVRYLLPVLWMTSYIPIAA